MKLNLKPVIASVGALAITGGVLAMSVGTAAAATPTWEPDPNALGTLTFYNSSGAVVTGGNNLSHLFDYAQASTADANTGSKAALQFAQPTFGQVTGVWPVGSASTSVATPPSAAPAPLNTSTTPVATSTGINANLQTFINGQTAQTQPGYVNVYQIRVVTTGGGGGSSGNAQYWDADVSVNPSAGTWTQVYPAVVTATNTTVSDAPNPSVTGGSVTSTATVTPAGTAGSVAFTDVTNPAVTFTGTTYTASTGIATASATFPATAAGDTIKATFTPTDLTSFSGSSGTTVQVVNPPATPTTTTLGVTQSGTAGTDVALSANVTGPGSTPNTAGTVSFYDNGSATPLNASPVTSTTGTYPLDILGGLAAGTHSIVAKFTPTNVANFQASQSSPQTFILQAPQQGACLQPGSVCSETQDIEGTIPVGTLVINTPYTPQNVLNLGTLALNTTGTAYTASANFNNIVVTDNRSGGAGWTAQALASSLTDGTGHPNGSINGQNVGLTFAATGAYTESAGDTAAIALTNNPAASPPVAPTDATTPGAGLGNTAKTFATSTPSASGNDGTVTINGSLTLNAPTATEAGLFTGTITFTVG